MQDTEQRIERMTNALWPWINGASGDEHAKQVAEERVRNIAQAMTEDTTVRQARHIIREALAVHSLRPGLDLVFEEHLSKCIEGLIVAFVGPRGGALGGDPAHRGA